MSCALKNLPFSDYFDEHSHKRLTTMELQSSFPNEVSKFFNNCNSLENPLSFVTNIRQLTQNM